MSYIVIIKKVEKGIKYCDRIFCTNYFLDNFNLAYSGTVIWDFEGEKTVKCLKKIIKRGLNKRKKLFNSGTTYAISGDYRKYVKNILNKLDNFNNKSEIDFY